MRKEITIPARISFTREAAERARSECFTGLVEERSVEDRVVMDFLTFSLEWLGRWVLSFGRDAEAVAPEGLREFVRMEAKRVTRLYSKTRHDHAADELKGKPQRTGKKVS